MTPETDGPEKTLLLALIDQAYEHKAWHGPNLQGSIRGVDALSAVRRPAPGRHNVAEQVLHAAYWKYLARRRLLGERRGAFPIAGSNWFVVDEPSEREWRGHVRLLDDQHRALREAVAEAPLARLGETPERGKYTGFELVQGIAAHDLYHAGQIQLIRRLISP